MDFKIQERKPYNTHKYSQTDFQLAKVFAEKLQKELGPFLRAVILFGSAAREKNLPTESDIDVLIIINDLTIILNKEVVQAYRIITEQTAVRVSKRLHITTLKLTSLWEYIRHGDPIAINMLRDGVVLYDTGFFQPMQFLLAQGRIRPTHESVWTYFARAPSTLLNSKWHVLQASIDLYWAAIDAAHAALMHVGTIPPSPAHVSKMINERLVKKGLVQKKYAETMDFFYNLSKKISHRQVQYISGKQYDMYYNQVEDFVNAMEKVIQRKMPGEK